MKKGLKILLKRKYSIVSKGTERGTGSPGYMNVAVNDDETIISPYGHFKDKYIFDREKSLVVRGCYSPEVISLSRFQLISALVLDRVNQGSNEILIIGFNSLAIGLTNELDRLSLTNYEIYSNRSNILQKIYKQFNFVESIKDKYDLYIDCSGKSINIHSIINVAKCLSTVILIGTPRDEGEIGLLKVHRKNLIIIGGHELNGFSQDQRNEMFKMVVKANQRKWELGLLDKSLFKSHKRSKGIISEILKNKYYEPIQILY